MVKSANPLRSVLISLVVAALGLVVFVLPAEYGIDPTGLGARMGIDGMSGVSVAAFTEEERGYREDYVEFALAPFESIEYKYQLDAGQSMVYSWETEEEVVFDMHSEEHGSDPEDATSFAIGRSAAQHGTYVAPYTGIHGWFWENRSQGDVIVKLRSVGYFNEATTFSAAGPSTREF